MPSALSGSTRRRAWLAALALLMLQATPQEGASPARVDSSARSNVTRASAPTALDDERASLRRRAELLAQAEKDLRATQAIVGNEILVSGTGVVQGITKTVSRVVADALDPTGWGSVVIELPDIATAADQGNQAFLTGDQAVARHKWAEAFGETMAQSAKHAAHLAHLQAVGLIAMGAEHVITLGEVGHELVATGNLKGVGDALLRRVYAVRTERAGIERRLIELDSETSGSSFDPSSLSAAAQANRKIAERNTQLTLIERGRREALERLDTLLDEHWRVSMSKATLTAEGLRLTEKTRSVASSPSGPSVSLSADELRRVIPSGWVPCQCPSTHPNAGLLIDGQRWHTSALNCSMVF